MLHCTGKRLNTIHSMNQISPKLAEIEHSVTPIPGEDGQFHTIHSVDQTVQVLPTKTRPKKLMFVESNDERIMQLLSLEIILLYRLHQEVV
ncbi:unnamed protein product [Rotaria socialis]